jgi:hypothetical protein
MGTPADVAIIFRRDIARAGFRSTEGEVRASIIMERAPNQWWSYRRADQRWIFITSASGGERDGVV